MQLTHNFTVPADIEQAWQVLLDIERIAPCMPGAALDTVDGDEFTGTVKVRLGPIGLTYRGKARWLTRDADSHRAVIDAQGKDARGNGTAKATITATLTAQGESTDVTVVTDLTITGKPAQFGRGVMVDVGNKLIGQFADCLAGTLAGPEPAGGADQPAGGPSDGADRPADGAGGAEPEVTAMVRAAAAAGAEQLGTADQDTVEQADQDTVDQADQDAADQDPGDRAAAEPVAPPAAVVAVPGPAPDEHPVEPAAAAEAAPPTQRIDRAAPGAAAPAGVPSVAHRPPPRRPTAAEVEPIDLLSSAGPAVAKRLAPVAAALALLIGWLLVRRRR